MPLPDEVVATLHRLRLRAQREYPRLVPEADRIDGALLPPLSQEELNKLRTEATPDVLHPERPKP